MRKCWTFIEIHFNFVTMWYLSLQNKNLVYVEIYLWDICNEDCYFRKNLYSSFQLLKCLAFCFKSKIGFQKFWDQILKYGHFRSESNNFLILIKFWLYPISFVLISNLIFTFCCLKQPSTQVTWTSSMSLFCNLVSFKILGLQLLFFLRCLLQIWY